MPLAARFTVGRCSESALRECTPLTEGLRLREIHHCEIWQNGLLELLVVCPDVAAPSGATGPSLDAGRRHHRTSAEIVYASCNAAIARRARSCNDSSPASSRSPLRIRVEM